MIMMDTKMPLFSAWTPATPLEAPHRHQGNSPRESPSQFEIMKESRGRIVIQNHLRDTRDVRGGDQIRTPPSPREPLQTPNSSFRCFFLSQFFNQSRIYFQSIVEETLQINERTLQMTQHWTVWKAHWSVMFLKSRCKSNPIGFSKLTKFSQSSWSTSMSIWCRRLPGKPGETLPPRWTLGAKRGSWDFSIFF